MWECILRINFNSDFWQFVLAVNLKQKKDASNVINATLRLVKLCSLNEIDIVINDIFLLLNGRQDSVPVFFYNYYYSLPLKMIKITSSFPLVLFCIQFFRCKSFFYSFFPFFSQYYSFIVVCAFRPVDFLLNFQFNQSDLTLPVNNSSLYSESSRITGKLPNI